jgi:hypothetical protein
MSGNIRNAHSGSYLFESRPAAVYTNLDFCEIPKSLQTDVNIEH